MSWWISSILIYCFIGLLTADTGFPARLSQLDGKKSLKETNGVKFDFEPSSSGMGPTDTDDEDLISSGSGLSGSGDGPTFETDWKETVTNATSSTVGVTTTSRPKSHCERARQENIMIRGEGNISCLDNGDYAALQCLGQIKLSTCQCVDLNGQTIPGTVMDPPNFPNCDNGENLPPCVFEVVKSIRSRLLGSRHPKCTSEGQFERIQCHENTCYCVDVDSGSKIAGTETSLHVRPDCEASVAKTTIEPEIKTYKPIKDVEVDPPIVPEDDDEDEDGDIDESDKDIINIDHTEDNKPEVDTGMDSTEKKTDVDIGKDSTENTEKEDDDLDDNKVDVSVQKIDKKPESESRVEKATSEIMTQPGILAGIIGGSVVVLLCLVLLIMFVVYRMRKKDEGSYPLDEPRKTPNYSYVRAPEKEFYA